MPIRKRQQSGDVLTADALNVTLDAALSAAGLRAGDGLEIANAPGNISISPTRIAEQRAGAVRAKLTGETIAPRFGVAELCDGKEGEMRGPSLVYCRCPEHAGYARLVLLHDGLTPNEIGWVQRDGVWLVAYDDTTIPAGVTLGTDDSHRLGSKHHSYYAQWDLLGPLKILGTVGAVVDDIGLALVEITRQRGDYVYVMNNGATVKGAAATVIFGNGYDVADVNGVITVTDA